MTHEQENGEYETMRSFKTCSKDREYLGKPQKANVDWICLTEKWYNDKNSN